MYFSNLLACMLVMVMALIGASQAISETSSADIRYDNESAVIETLTPDQALSLAFKNNPDLLASSTEIEAREAKIIQSGAFPNPSLEIGLDNIYGNKDLRNFDGAETSFSLSQLIELGGKRSKRTELAKTDFDLSKWDYEAKKNDLQADVVNAFINVAGEQERVTLLEELLRIAEHSLTTVAARVQSGKVSPIDETKAAASMSLVRMELERAKQSLKAARNRLASFWGGTGSSFIRIAGESDVDPLPPVFDELHKAIANNPDIARWESEIRQRKISLNIEEANRIPDPSLSGGVKYFNETDERTFFLGVSVPLPVFNTNRGAILEAEKRIAKAEEERKAAVLKIQNALSDAYLALTTAYTDAKTLRSDILPAMQSAYDKVSEGYRYGKFGYLDLLDTQRTFFESKMKYLDSITAYRKAKTDVLRLTGSGSKFQPVRGE